MVECWSSSGELVGWRATRRGLVGRISYYSGWPSAFGGGLEGFGGAELSAVEEFLLVLTWWVFTMVGVALCSGSGAEVWLLSRRFCALLIYCPFGIGRRVFPMSILAISGNFGSTGYGGSFGASKEEGG